MNAFVYAQQRKVGIVLLISGMGHFFLFYFVFPIHNHLTQFCKNKNEKCGQNLKNSI